MKFNTLFVGNVVRHFTEVSSTNTVALEEIAKTTPSEGTVISTDYQRAGRGQIGSSWFATPAKNLLLSIILRPRWLTARRQFTLSQAVALAVADTITAQTGITAQVKWPNDIYLQERKLAGILIQNTLAGAYLQTSVVGIGLNVNEDDFPTELSKAGSLLRATGSAHDRDAVRERLFHHLEARYLQLKSRPAAIRTAYLQQLYRYQEWHPYRNVTTGKIFQGMIVGVQENGKLAIQTDARNVEYFDIKAIAFQ